MHESLTDQAGTVGGGARRRRPLLASLTTLGIVAGLLGVAGVFAAGSDQATTGTNDAFSGENGGGGGEDDIDIQLATATMDYETGTFTCNDDWTDDLESGVIVSDGNELGTEFPAFGFWDEGAMCLRNIGTSDASVSLSAFNPYEYELGCSPGEAEAGDTTCGFEGVGELASDLMVAAYYADPTIVDLSNCNSESSDAVLLADLLTESSVALRDVPAGSSVAFCLGAGWIGSAIAQSDAASWQFAFDAVLDDGSPDPGDVPDPIVCENDDAFEENDWYPTATAYPSGSSVQALGCTDSSATIPEMDWYSYSHPGGTFQADLQFDETVSDLDLLLYTVSEDGEVIYVADSTSIDADEAIFLADLPAGEYYVIEAGYQLDGNALAPQPYTLTAESFAN